MRIKLAFPTSYFRKTNGVLIEMPDKIEASLMLTCGEVVTLKLDEKEIEVMPFRFSGETETFYIRTDVRTLFRINEHAQLSWG